MDDSYALFPSSADKDNRQPLTVDVCLDGIPHRMELDTGASISLMAKSTLWPGRAFSPTTISLKTYTGEQVRVLGTIHVNVKYQATVATLPLLVTEVNGSLFIKKLASSALSKC